MMVNIIMLVAGFILLVKGADMFVSGASALGVKFKVPQIVVGLTVVAFGTSLPETVINVIASINKNNDIVLGNIIGSNIFNIMMILGIAAVIFPITAQKNTVWKEIPFVILVSLIMFILANDSMFGENISVISRGDGIILLIFMGYFLYYLLNLAKNGGEITDEISELPGKKITLFLILGIIGLIAGGNLVVNGAVAIAKALNVSDKIIALTIIAMGTGLPELVTSIVAATKKNSSIALGNIVGSNIFNILMVIGVSSIIYPISYNPSLYNVDMTIMIVSSLILFITMFALKRATITRTEGFIMLSIYLGYIGFSIIR